MPVTRPPPCSPGRAVVPPPVPRWYAPPRCTAVSSCDHPSLFGLREPRPCYRDSIEALRALRPGTTRPLPASSLAPCAHTAPGPLKKALKRARVPLEAVVIVVALYPGGQPPVAFPPRPVPGRREPCREPLAGGLELLACCPPCDARPPPAELAASSTRSPARESAGAGQGARGCTAGGGAALGPPGGGIARTSSGARASSVRRRPESGRRPPRHRRRGTAGPRRDRGLAPWGPAPVQGLIPRGICADRGHRSPWRGPGLGG
jgi:hypothetical protein